MLQTEKEKIACLKSYWARNNIIKYFVKPLRKAEAFLILRDSSIHVVSEENSGHGVLLLSLY
jgi:hypothetical protein